MKISVIIPALNEEARIERTLRRAREQEGPLEVLVVDGGSEDRTRELAARQARVIRSAPGRARQMNAGAAEAAGEVFLFLHADTLLPPHALAAVRQALADPQAEAGAFRLRFDVDAPLLRFYSLCTRLPLPRLCFGDRGLFVRRRVFEAVGGFPEMPLFEDLELVQKLHRRGGFRFLDESVVTAARRFEAHGRLRQQLRNTYLWLHYLAGTDPATLQHLYRYAGREPFS